MADLIRTSVVIVAYGAEPWLERSVEAALGAASDALAIDVVVVDNGCTDGAVDRLDGRPGVLVVRPGENLGFAGGCNAGVAASTGEVLCLINPDAIVSVGAISALTTTSLRPDVGIATARVVLADRPDRLNSAGNEVHFTGVSWSGSFGERVSEHRDARPAAAASGAAMAVRRSVWDSLGGFDDLFFAYYEDADLSLRCWQRGLSVVYEPTAEVVHRYEFSKNPTKHFLLERNRALLVLGCYGTRMLVVLAPVLLALELATFGLALAQGWAGAKLRSWAWLVRNWRAVRARRQRVQTAREVDDKSIALLFTVRLDPGNFPLPRWLLWLNGALAMYWRVARKLI